MARRNAIALAACLVTLAMGVLAAPASALVKGSLTMEIDASPEGGDAIAKGKIDTKKICGAYREIKVKLLNAPQGYPDKFDEYALPNGKRYTVAIFLPSEAGVYEFKAVAKQTRVARGLKRAKCAKMKSDVVEVTVEPPVEF